MGIVAMLGYTYDWMGFELTKTRSLINVLNFGAIGDGSADDSQAFLKAWSATCGSTSNDPSMIIPGNKTFLVKQPVRFEGPCFSSSINVQVWGDIKAPDMMNFGDINSHTWLVFSKVDGLIVSGTGKIDGTGKSWWDSCPKETDCKKRPAALTFNRCNNLQLSGLTHVDSADNHISITNCEVATISNIHITAPKTSPNTDGIDISYSTRIQIHDSYIGTGDDCIAMIDGCKFINITGVNCGPGHGISIGSLGINGSRATVEELHVNNCTFNGTQNGARIKTWQGGSGSVQGVLFSNIQVSEVELPIVIDQYYCDKRQCKNQTSAVSLSGITFEKIKGTYTVKPVHLACSDNLPCVDVMLTDIELKPQQEQYHMYDVFCWQTFGELNSPTVPPIGCLHVGKPSNNRIQNDHDLCYT
ncbi:hypothetical protein ACSBR2_006625 [Camellia fascicularis]